MSQNTTGKHAYVPLKEGNMIGSMGSGKGDGGGEHTQALWQSHIDPDSNIRLSWSNLWTNKSLALK